MDELDMSGVDPLRYEEVRRRVAVVKDYIAIPFPTELDQKAHGIRLGLSINQFMALARVWREYGSPERMAAAGAHRRGTRRPSRLAIDPKAKQVAAETITEIGSHASSTDITLMVFDRCAALDVKPPSRSTIWNMVMAERQNTGSENTGVVVGTCMVRLPVATEAGIVQPMLTIAVRARDGAIVAAALGHADWQTTAATIAASTVDDASVRIDKELLRQKCAVSMRAGVEPIAGEKARTALSRVLGRGIGDIQLIYRPSKAVDPERLLTTKEDRPLSSSDARTIIMAAVERHNSARGARPAPWIDAISAGIAASTA